MDKGKLRYQQAITIRSLPLASGIFDLSDVGIGVVRIFFNFFPKSEARSDVRYLGQASQVLRVLHVKPLSKVGHPWPYDHAA
jgi:hypothetical protein